jgi:NADPH2:quinone reductase
MKAVTISRFGGPEVLTVAELLPREPGPGEVRIRVRAATVNPTDLGLRAGGRSTALPFPYIPGMEAAGTIDAIGPGVAGRQIDEPVMAIVLPMRPEGGAQQELVVVPNDAVAPIPDGWSYVEAATLPMNGLTVRRAFDLMGLAAGATVGVTGAAGAVGGYAIQMGKVAGYRIVADARMEDVPLIRELGADIVVERGPAVGSHIRNAVSEGVDGLLDAAVQGAEVLSAVRDGGQVAAVRLWSGGTERGITIHQVAVTQYATNRRALEELGRLAAAGRITPRVAATFAPEDAAEAHRRLEAGGVRGRLVIVFSH